MSGSSAHSRCQRRKRLGHERRLSDQLRLVSCVLFRLFSDDHDTADLHPQPSYGLLDNILNHSLTRLALSNDRPIAITAQLMRFRIPRTCEACLFKCWPIAFAIDNRRITISKVKLRKKMEEMKTKMRELRPKTDEKMKKKEEPRRTLPLMASSLTPPRRRASSKQ